MRISDWSSDVCSSDLEEELEDVLRQAQAALKLAKKSGKLAIYRPGVLREARHRFNLESNLREALATGRLELAFHPLIDLQNGAVTGVEALLCWTGRGQGPSSQVGRTRGGSGEGVAA